MAQRNGLVNDLLGMALNLPVFVLVLCRASGIMLTAPILSSVEIPDRVKVGLTCLLSLIMYPLAAQHAGVLPAGVLGYAPLVLRELGLGLLMGFAGGLVLGAMRAAGSLAAQTIGLGMSDVSLPDEEDTADEISTFFDIFCLLVFLAVDGHHWFIQALAISYRDIPLGQVHFSPAIAAAMQTSFSNLFLYALRGVAPLMGIMFLVNVMLALMAKAVPQMNILVVGYPVKVFVGVLALALTFPLTWPVMHDAFSDLHTQLIALSRAL
jgi:flagellar biosynthetic protein FliR